MPAKSSSSAPSEDFTASVQDFIMKDLICWPMATGDSMQTLGSHGWQPSCFTEEQLAFMKEQKDTPEAQWVSTGKSDNGRWKINNNDAEFRKAVNAYFRDGHNGRKFTQIEINGRLNLIKSEGKTMALPVDSSKPFEDRAATRPFVDAGAAGASDPNVNEEVDEWGDPIVPAPITDGSIINVLQQELAQRRRAITPPPVSNDNTRDFGEKDPNATKRELSSVPKLDRTKFVDLETMLSGRSGIVQAASKGIDPASKSALQEAVAKTVISNAKSKSVVTVATSEPPPGFPPSTGSPPPPPPPPPGAPKAAPPAAPSAAPPAAPVSEPVAARVTRSASNAAPPTSSWAGSWLGSAVGYVTGTSGPKTLDNQPASGSTSPGSLKGRESSGIPPSTEPSIAWEVESGPVLHESEMEHNLRKTISDQGDRMKVLEERVTQLQVERGQLMNDVRKKDIYISNLELENGALKVGNNNADQISDLIHQANVWEKRYDETEAGRLQWIQRYDAEVGKNSYLREEVKMVKDSYEEERDRALKEIAHLKAQLTSSSSVSRAQYDLMETELRQAKRDLENAKRAPPSSTATSSELQLRMDFHNSQIELDNLTRKLQASKAKVTALEQARSMPPPLSPASTTLPSLGGLDLQKKLAVALKEKDDAMTLVSAQMQANRKLTNDIADLQSSAGNTSQSATEIQRLNTEIADLKRQASLAYSPAPTRTFTVSSVPSAPSRSVTTSSFVSASSSISSSMSESETVRKLARMEEKYNHLYQMYEELLRETGKRSGTTPDTTIARYEAYKAAQAARSTRR
jgi:hypothetical protein